MKFDCKDYVVGCLTNENSSLIIAPIMATRRVHTHVPRQCGHCGTKASMLILDTITDYSENYDLGFSCIEGSGYKLMKCTNCGKPELEKFDYCDALDPHYFGHKVLYPAAAVIPAGLPKKVKNEYLEAVKHRHSSPNAYGSLLGRVIEAVCKDKKAPGKRIGEQIDWMAKQNLLPPQIRTAAFRQNDFRILAVHADAGRLTKKQVPILEHLTRAILEYVYSIPYQIKLAVDALSKTSMRPKILPVPPPKPPAKK